MTSPSNHRTVTGVTIVAITVRFLCKRTHRIVTIRHDIRATVSEVG